MIDSATIDEAIDLLECAGWKGYAQAVREQSNQIKLIQELLSALVEIVRIADRDTPEFNIAKDLIAKFG